ncbi:hypothetical protein A6X21_12100 [Planctopirus hydrillae]|uniref:Uncharacterized protein n=1 Tax=Planctopirus hydrillae TaxID=1841610 RepID=A0A1C3E5D7_9PLAN|nr:hypothetical protein A6X21_12100 [Planctopirus hydrillae]
MEKPEHYTGRAKLLGSYTAGVHQRQTRAVNRIEHLGGTSPGHAQRGEWTRKGATRRPCFPKINETPSFAESAHDSRSLPYI